jgi:hypothetical protein
VIIILRLLRPDPTGWAAKTVRRTDPGNPANAIVLEAEVPDTATTAGVEVYLGAVLYAVALGREAGINDLSRPSLWGCVAAPALLAIYTGRVTQDREI